MKRTLLLCAALLALQAQAQPKPAAAPASPSAKPQLEVNPFTGKPLSVEQIQRELEEAKLRTAVLEEALKQSNLQEELQALPARKSVELAQARTAVKREEVAMSDLESQRRSADAQRQAAERAAVAQAQREEDATRQARKEAAERAAAAKRDAARKAKEERDAARKAKLAPKEDSSRPAATESAAAAPAKALPKVALTSVMSFGNKHSAVLDVNGESMVVEDGAMTNFGSLRVLGRDSVELNGVQLNVVSSGVSRFAVSDPKPVDPTKPASMDTRPVSLPVQTTAPVVSQIQGNQPSGPAGSSLGAPRATLPPLQLPPGMAVLPSGVR